MGRSDLFNAQSYNAYVRWEKLDKQDKPRSPVVLGVCPEDGTEVWIGRVSRDGHIVPGAIRNGVCKYRFDGEWFTESERIEVLTDRFGMADTALVWRSDFETKDGVTLLPVFSEVGGMRPISEGQDEFGEPTGLYLLARPKGTLDIVPLHIHEDNRHYNEGHIAYRGTEKDFEVLKCEYSRYVAICPPPPPRPEKIDMVGTDTANA